MTNYEIIMKYESIMDSVALDNNIYFLTDEERKKDTTKEIIVPIMGIGTVPFEVRSKAVNMEKINDYTFNAYHLYEFEMISISNIIDIAMKKSFIWKYDDLLTFI